MVFNYKKNVGIKLINKLLRKYLTFSMGAWLFYILWKLQPHYFYLRVFMCLSSSCTKLFFSSPVEEQFSKLKISRKQGKIFCEFPKKTMGLVGESCIQNPAQLVMEELPWWNSSEDHFS